MSSGSDRTKRVVAGIYSVAADRLYDPIVVKGAFRLLGGRLNDLVREAGSAAVRHAAGGPILDMPVGTGYFTLGLARQHTGVVVGSDLARGMVERTRRDALADGVTNLIALQADAHRLPFGDGSFPAVVCANGLQVIPGLDESCAELARVLAPGGRLFVTVVVLPLDDVVGAAAGRLPTFLRNHRNVVDALERRGLDVRGVTRSRLAYGIEAAKPPR